MVDNVSGCKYSDYKSEGFKSRINSIVISKPSKVNSIKRVSFSNNPSENISIDNDGNISGLF